VAYEIKFLKEHRFTLKILAHKIRKYFPYFIYEWMLWFRFLFFKKRCSNLSSPQLKYSDGSWVMRKTTADLTRIQNFLQGAGTPLAILQIGIGNSSLYSTLRTNLRKFMGITISEEEIEYAKSKFPAEFGSQYQVRLMNKYSADIDAIGDKFDYIVDNDLSSYACCHFHFNEMLKGYGKLLLPHGVVLIGIDGLGYFDSGFGLTQSMIEKIASSHGLVFQAGTNFHQLKLAADL
jgi:hypothetical protein